MNRRSFFGGIAAFVGSFFTRSAQARTLRRGVTYTAGPVVSVGKFYERTELPILPLDPAGVRPITFVNFENVGVGLIDVLDDDE